jgi:hypothetical protein
LGFGVWGLGFGVWGLGFGVWGYAAIVNWEGRPGPYHLERADALEKELGEVEADFARLVDGEAKPLGLDPQARAVASGRGSPRAGMHALRYHWHTPDLVSTMREKKRR